MSVSKFQLSLLTHSLEQSHQFFTQYIGCQQIQRGQKYIKYNLSNHQLTIYFIGSDFRPQQHKNNVDQHAVPIPHFGIVLSVQQFKKMSQVLIENKTQFIVYPYLRFKGLVGEQYTMFFKDPTGNNLQFKAMTNPSYLFAK